jgi:hypothetical protein
MAAYFGITEKTFRAIEQRQSEAFTAYSRGRARAVVDIGSALYQKALGGDLRAIQFYLKTQAGWTEKHALEVSQAEPEVDDRKWLVEVMSVND